MKLKKMLFVIALATTCLLAGCAHQTEKPAEYETASELSKVTFDLEAHRGGRNARPENTMYSYLYAIESGATTIECDMQYNQDGQIYMSHNAWLNSAITRDEDGNYISSDAQLDIRSMTADEIDKYNVAAISEENDPEYYEEHALSQVTPDSAQIPTIDELFGMIRDLGYPVYVNIETKLYPEPEDIHHANNADAQAFVETFYGKVVEYGMEDYVILQSFDLQSLVIMEEIDPEIKTAFLVENQPTWGRDCESLRPYEDGGSPFLAGYDIDDYKGDYIKLCADMGIDYISPYYNELSIEQVEEAHNSGIKVVPWTVNTVEGAAAMYNMGVDGIISDNPWVVREYIQSQGEILKTPSDLSDSEYGRYHLDKDHIDTDKTAVDSSAR